MKSIRSIRFLERRGSLMFTTVDGNAGFFLSVFNLMNAILGSGILGLSYAMAQLGILLFTLICGGVAGLALYAITLLLEMCKITGANVSPKVYIL